MQDDTLTDLVRSYFEGVDTENLDQVLETLHPDCTFTVETYGEIFHGHAEIIAVLGRLWRAHASVSHHGFRFVPCAERGRIAVQFKVTNTLPDGREVHKSNCNFFTVENGRFTEVSVYMAGDNTLRNT